MTYPPVEPPEGEDVTKWPAIAPPEPDQDPGIVIRFSFWLVTGATFVEPSKGAEGEVWEEGNATYTNAPTINIGCGIDTNVVATAWYYDDDANAKDLQIDAFDMSIGDFIDDDFVNVEKPHESLTQEANELGLVRTSAEPEGNKNVVAYSQIRGPFVRWKPPWGAFDAKSKIYVNPTGGAAGRALTAEHGSNGIAWAYYRAPYELNEPKNRKAEPDPPPPFWRIWQMVSALSAVITAGLGAGIFYLFQTASAASRPWVTLLGVSLAATIGYVLPGIVSRSFRRS